MFGHDEFDDKDFRTLSNGVAAGTTTQTTSAVDVKDGEQVILAAVIGTITSTGVPVITPQYSLDGTNYTDLTAYAVTLADTDSDKQVIFNIPKCPPTWQKMRLKIARGTANAVITFAYAILAKGRKTGPLGYTGASPLSSEIKAYTKVLADA